MLFVVFINVAVNMFIVIAVSAKHLWLVGVKYKRRIEQRWGKKSKKEELAKEPEQKKQP